MGECELGQDEWQWRAVGKGWGTGDVGIGHSGGSKLSKAAKLLSASTNVLCVLDGFVTVGVRSRNA